MLFSEFFNIVIEFIFDELISIMKFVELGMADSSYIIVIIYFWFSIGFYEFFVLVLILSVVIPVACIGIGIAIVC